jgi:Brp/Blh family beta-carotene 15,15'-monooxygenase
MVERDLRAAHWDTMHALCFVLAVSLLAFFARSLNTLTVESQLLALAVLALIIGIPHGALDLPVARRWLMPRWGWAWVAVFLGCYITAAAPVAAGWMAVPGLTLGFFLLTSIYHFGLSDTERSGLAPKRRLLEGLGRGLAPVTVTAWAWTDRVETLFGHLAGPHAASLLAEAAAALGPTTFLPMAAAAAWRLADLRHGDRRHRHRAGIKALELILLPILFMSLQPLLAFTVYWIGLHSLHVLLIFASRQEQRVLAGAWSVYRLALPATASTIALAALAYAGFLQGQAPIAAGMSIIFMGLAVLNTPHMLFVSVTAKYR